ncbi:Lin1 family protein [Lasiosphaeria miniovina]|uniref:Lin1 family protein n=1 Tax=Lasiosphaeria miniovina TaxID=1954250 RepID=A0AA40DKI4_9PEZI|nr:Lin1 family protein [Lasiosphaeria miniovina]KAK0706580.1 Lin1 family protein [Lasiosphaeria miniovina]
MASRFSAARPKRAGEEFARVHHREDDDTAGGSKKVRFDVRNPSALAPTARDSDSDDNEDLLAADVIGTTGRATKRGAINIDGYDSDSENEFFNARAEERKSKKKGVDADDVDLAKAMDSYNSSDVLGDNVEGDDDEIDMFGEDNDDDAANSKAPGKTAGKKNKDVRFLADDEIEGQEAKSKSGGRIRLDGNLSAYAMDDNESSDDDDDDDADIDAAIAEEGIDEEVGLGGLKKHAPKIDAFNMRQEQEEGAFDDAGNYIRKAIDADSVHDRWLDDISKKDMKKAAAAREKRDAEMREKQRQDDSILTSDLLKALILRLERGETVLEALARLGKAKTKFKKVPSWKLKKMKKTGSDAMDVDMAKEKDPKDVKITQVIEAITDAADKLLQRDYRSIYDTERERLVRDYHTETGEDWVEPAQEDEEAEGLVTKTWEFRWVDGRDDADKQGPFDGKTMKAWQDAGYFAEGVEFRHAGDEHGWTRVATFV